MAIKHFDCKGFGQIEPSQVWFTRAGMSESQCFLDEDKFASNFPMTPAEQEAGKIYAENGAFLMVDKQNKTATVPNKDMSDKGYPMGINYSSEKIYNQYTPGRRNFCLVAGEALPRIGYVEPGMRVCTNTVCWDDTCELFSGITGPDESGASTSVQMYRKVKERLATGNPVYAFVTDDSNGKLVIGTALTNAIGNVYAQVTECYTNADTTLAFKIQFINKPAADAEYGE